MCLAHPQLEELSLLLTQLRQHQARLASVRNFAIGQLLQHQLTFPSCQVSAGGPSQGWGPPGGQGVPCWPVLRRAPALVCPAVWLSPLFLPVCFWMLLPDTVRPSWGPRPWCLGAAGEAAWGVRDLDCGFSACE